MPFLGCSAIIAINKQDGRVCRVKVTIQDVADRAGVSIATVSHILNKTRYVRPELVERVEKAIAETGYIGRAGTPKDGLMLGKQ